MSEAMIAAMARRAIDGLLAQIEVTAANEPADDLKIERDGERIVLTGPRVRLRALTEARILSLFGAGRR